MPAVVGDIMVQALKVEHRELNLKIEAALDFISGIKFERLKDAEIPAVISEIKQT